MKKLFLITVILATITAFTGCNSTAIEKPVDPVSYLNDDSFSEFTLDGDLSWLEGTWDLIRWEVDDHGTMKDNTSAWKHHFFEVNGKSKTSQLIEEYKNAKTDKISRYEYSVEKYFTLNNHVKGHFNNVNPEKKHSYSSKGIRHGC